MRCKPPRHCRCCYRLGSDDRENHIRLQGWGRGVVIDQSASKHQKHQQHQQPQQENQQQHTFSASSSRTQRLIIPPLSVFQHHQEPTQLRANNVHLNNSNSRDELYSHHIETETAPRQSPAIIVLPDPMDLTADFDSNAWSGFSRHSIPQNEVNEVDTGHPRIVVLPSPPSSSAPTPRDHMFSTGDDHRHHNGPHQQNESQFFFNDAKILLSSAARIQPDHQTQEQQHRQHSPAAPLFFERQISQPFPADLSPVPPAVSPSSLLTDDPPPPRYSPMPVRSVFKLEAAIQASAVPAVLLSPGSESAEHVLPKTHRVAPQTSLAVITGSEPFVRILLQIYPVFLYSFYHFIHSDHRQLE